MTTSAEKLPITSLWERLDTPGMGEYLEAGGYGTAIKTAKQGGRKVIPILRDAILRTLDGAGNPVFMNWRAAQIAPAEHKYVICVADDPDPDFPIYRELLSRSPHLVIEGMICGALAVGAAEAYIYLRKEEHELVAGLETALQEALAEGLIGEDALLDIHIVTGDRSFFVWDAEHQYRYLEELIGQEVTVARGVVSGLFGWPTVLHNPETWAHVSLVLANGAEWYRSLGHGMSGTKLVNLKGPVNHPGIYEVPLGMPLGEILEERGGGLKEGVEFKALQLGGMEGGFLASRHLELPLDFEILAEHGVSMGSGALEVLDDTVCMSARTLELVFKALDGFQQEMPEEGRLFNQIKRLLGEVEGGSGTRNHLASLEREASELLARTSTGSERSVARPLLTALTHFRFDFIHHVEQGVCATGVRKGLETAPCQAACPAGIDIPTYLALIGKGQYREAIEVIRRDNPLPWVCGIICTHPCEAACTRGEMDQPISIMALKGFAAEQVIAVDGGYPVPECEPRREEKVAVVGSGPAGLSAAFFLAKKGYQVTIFEALPVAGGVLAVGIPEYRLPIAVVQREIDEIVKLGVEIKTGLRVGRDVTLDELREEGYKAFFLGVGAHAGVKLGIEGEAEYSYVTDALSFLREVRMGRKSIPADKVVVVGGGNAAIDAARTCVRLGCSKVTIAYRRTRSEMPAWEEEIIQAEEEGVEIRYLTIPKRVVGTDGKVTGLECLEAELGEADASGRRRPVPIQGSEYIIEAQAVIAAIGQRPDVSCFAQREQVAVDTRSRLAVDSHTLQTNVPDVFAGGDVVTGPATVVQAVGAGKWAAESIHAYLQGLEMPMGPPLKKPHMRIDPIEMPAEAKGASRRASMPLLDLEQRKTTFKRVELGLSEEDARREGGRCLRCDLCVGCGLCEAVCAEMGIKAFSLSATAEGRLALTDFHRPARSCIGCGACVQVCPHRNIRMLDQGDHRHIVFCGTQTAHLELASCDECGAVMAPEAFLGYLQRMLSDTPDGQPPKRLCPACARKHWAEGQMGDVLWFPPAS